VGNEAIFFLLLPRKDPRTFLQPGSSRGTKRSSLSAVCFGNFSSVGHRGERSDLLSFIASQRPTYFFAARVNAYAIVEVNFLLLIQPLFFYDKNFVFSFSVSTRIADPMLVIFSLFIIFCKK